MNLNENHNHQSNTTSTIGVNRIQSIDLSEFEPKPITPIKSNTTTNNSWTTSADDRPISSANATIIINQSPRTPFTPIKKQQSLHHHQSTPTIKSSINNNNNNTLIRQNNTPIKQNNTPIKTNYTPIKQNSTPIQQNSTPIKSNNTPIRQSINPQLVLLQSNSIKPKARVTPEAIPRKKQILPGAPNPITFNSQPNSIFSPSTLSYKPSSIHSHSHYYDSNQDLDVDQLDSDEDEDQFNQTSIDQNVLVAIRLRSTDSQSKSLWELDEQKAQIWESNSLGPTHDSTFDAVFGPSCTNLDVYRSSGTKDLIHSSMIGYDSTIFAYGQTASGKTFTLTGSHSQPGLIPLAISDIFEFIRSHPHRDFLLRASYLEIYNEQINDLLIPPKDPRQPIKIRQDPSTKNFFPCPIREEVVTTEAQVEDLLNRGNLTRHVSGTDFNHRSSRSHTILCIVIESRKVGKFDGIVRRSKVSLIDLAGSERATSDGSRRAEGAFINKSLLTLEKVIGALSPDSPNPSSNNSKKPFTQHIPFRDSKLTQILQPALKGDSKVCVICTMNPTLNHGNGLSNGNGLEESRSTLRFARRVKKVMIKAEVNEILSERALITRYRQQIVELQNQLDQAMQASITLPPNPTTTTQESTQEIVEEREEMLERLEKLQSIVLNAANLDEYKFKKRRESCLARPVSPVKEGNRGEEDDEDDRLDEIKEETQSFEKIHHPTELKNKSSSLLVSKKTVGLEEEIDLMELNELRLIVSNSLNQSEECIKESYELRIRLILKENAERKRFGEEMVKLLEASQLKAKKLELFIINELQNSLKKKKETKQRIGRRSSIGTYFTNHPNPNSKRQEEEDEEDEDGLMDLKNEVPEMRSLRASFGRIEIGEI